MNGVERELLMSVIGGGLLLLLAFIAVFWVGLGVGRQTEERVSQNRERSAGTLLDVIRIANTPRREVEVTLGRILEETAHGLGAYSASLHVAKKKGGMMELVRAVRVQDFTRLAHIMPSDPLLASIEADGGVTITDVTPGSAWSALTPDGKPLPLTAALVGQGADRRGVLALTWRENRTAALAADTVWGVGQYAYQIVTGSEALEQRVRDFEHMSAQLKQVQTHVRTLAHDMGTQLAAPIGWLEIIRQNGGAPEYG